MFTSFLYPTFLLAGLAAAIPLILHLIQRLRVVRLPFSTIRFLELAKKKAARRTRIENLLLLFLRMLVILLIAAAFAMPMLKTGSLGAFLRDSDRDVAIVIDGSYSMQYRVGAATAWDRAVEAAEAVMDGLGGGDRVCIYVARDVPRPVIEQLTTDKEFALELLQSVTPNATEARLGEAVAAAHAVLDRQSGNRERELHIITDGQELAWSSFDTGAAPAAGTFVTLTGVPAPENTAVAEARLTPPLILPGMSPGVSVRLGSTGSPGGSPVALYVDGREIARRQSDLVDSRSGEIRFSIPPLDAGTHEARVELPADNLPVDNVLHFLVRVRDNLPALCVGDKDSTFYLMRALNPAGETGSGMQVKRLDAADVANEDLAQYSCVFLCNALPVPGQAIVALERYVEAGGLLIFFPGDAGGPADYSVWRCLPGMPSSIQDIPIVARRCILRWEKPQHPIVRSLKPRPGETPVATIRRSLRWKQLHEDGSAIIAAGAGLPLLVQRRFGNGEVLMFSVSADRSWGNLPLSPYFLPIVHQLVQHGMGMSGNEPYVWTAAELPLAAHLPAATRQSSLLNPAGIAVPIRSDTVDGKTGLRATGLTVPGIYSFMQSPTTRPGPALAVNLDRKESNLAVVAHDRIPELVGNRGTRVANTVSALRQLLVEHRVGRTFGEQLLWLALIAAMVEVMYANRKSGRNGAPSRSEIPRLRSG